MTAIQDLQAGADVNMYTHKGHTCLMEALVWQEDPECAFVVMDAGVDLYNRDLDGFLPLHHAVCFNRLPVVAKMLDMGVDIESRSTSHGETGLLMAARRNLGDMVRLLVERGADLEARDIHRYTPLLRAVDSSSHVTLQLLLDAQTDHRVVTALGKTLLHVAASRANLETLQMLSTVPLAGVDEDAVDSQNMTTMDRFTTDNPSFDDEAVKEAFAAVLRQVEVPLSDDAPSSARSETEQSGEDEFYDAE
jgi:ankyrin repeat protein